MSTSLRRIRWTLALCALAGLAACQQERNTSAPVSSKQDVPPATAAAATTAQPAQVPAGDPSLPPAGTANAAASGSDATHTALTKGERDTALPLEGQVNNYSSDAFAKRGDEQIPRGSPDAPRGNEAVSTPNSYPKESK